MMTLVAGIGLTACGPSSGTPKPSPTSVPSTAKPAAAQSPAGTWNTAYTSSPATFFGQYTITESGGTYTLTTKTALTPPYLNCSLPPGTEEGTFTAVGPTTYAGNGKLWTQGTCTYGYMSPIELRFSGNELILQYSNGGGPLSFTLTRVGTTPPSAPATTPAQATTPSTQAGQAGTLPTVSGVSNVAEIPQVRPNSILLFADGSFSLDGITWSSWTTSSATGTGTLYSSNGNPSMATGTKSNIPVSIALSAPSGGSNPYFTRMVVTDSSGRTDTFSATYKQQMIGQTSGITANGSGSLPSPSSVAAGAPGGYTACGTGTGDNEVYAGANTSCSFAISVEEAYSATGSAMPSSGSRSVTAYSSVTGQSYTMNCANTGQRIICTGGNNASVAFQF